MPRARARPQLWVQGGSVPHCVRVRGGACLFFARKPRKKKKILLERKTSESSANERFKTLFLQFSWRVMSGRRSVRPGYKRLCAQLPEELVREVYAHAGRSVSAWIEAAVREKLEEERSRQLLTLLPSPLREKLVKAAGGEAAASRLLPKLVEKGLAELEEEEVVQEALGEVHRRERLAEPKRG